MENLEQVNIALCPICGEDNQCATAANPEAKTCWCRDEVFPEGIFELVPENLIRKTCICIKCLQKYKDEN